MTITDKATVSLLSILSASSLCLSLEWNSMALLQPGPCPNPPSIASSFDMQQMKGPWNVIQMPRQFPSCCQRPNLDLADVTALSPQSKINLNDSYKVMKAAVDWSPCTNDYQRKSVLVFRLRPNPMLSASFLMELPWPLNVAGFATLNIISTDYKSFAAGYICHTLLLEHLLIPFTLGRLNIEIDATLKQHIKWNMVKQGIFPAWDLTDSVGVECNSLPTPATHPVEETFFHFSTATPALPDLTGIESLPSANVTTGAPERNSTSDYDEEVTHDPDTDAEWITSDSNQVKRKGHPIPFPADIPVPAPTAYPPTREIPGSYPGLGGIWPSIFFGEHDPEETKNATINSGGTHEIEVKLAEDPIDDGRMAHFDERPKMSP